MSFNTLSDIYYRICEFIHDSTAGYDFSGFSLSQDGMGNIVIQSWGYNFDQPVYADLENIDYSDVVEYFSQQTELNKVVNLALLSTATINSMTPSNGDVVFDKTTNRVKCFYNSVWNEL